MRMTTKAQYAIVALTNMKKKLQAGNSNPVRLQEISAEEKISLHYLEQLFRKLRVAKIVRSIRGPGGGYVLTKESISYKQVLEAVGEEVSVSSSIDDKSAASNDVVANLSTIYGKLTGAFEQVTI